MLDMVEVGGVKLGSVSAHLGRLERFICQLSHVKELTKLFGRVLFNFCRFCGHLHLLLDHAFLGDVADNHLDSAVQRKDSHRSGGCNVEQVYFIVTGHWVELWVGHPESRHRAEQSPSNPLHR